MVKTRSLYLTWAWFGTGPLPGHDTADGQTDRIPIANTRSQQYLPVQLSHVKTELFDIASYRKRVNTQPSLCHYAVPLIRSRHTALYKCVLIDWLITDLSVALGHVRCKMVIGHHTRSSLHDADVTPLTRFLLCHRRSSTRGSSLGVHRLQWRQSQVLHTDRSLHCIFTPYI